ncbi:MAG: AAA family ATPase [Cellulomonas sp.]|uniref:ATP-dependent nuclease n=1 Tax=Cellulomonas sp. 73-92 TaxID=1895740 RepID=UPI001AD18E13|nr:AAA family ATPase [Cellulomonas sp. 73-92]MBN9375823.1 AAA family ATPase [Cellulomonas sp.]
MRLQAIEIRNFKGIAYAQVSDLATESVVTISGRNGTGKSLFLEAVVAAWSERYSLAESVGPWSDELSISLVLTLANDEWDLVDDWHQRMYSGPAPREPEVSYEVRANRAGVQARSRDSTTAQILRSQPFQREHPFSRIDLLAATRLVAGNESAVVDLAMLNPERVDQDRWNMLDSFIRQRSPMSLPSIASYLVTLDYQAFLAGRQGLDVPNEYERLQSAFGTATGKGLHLPEYDPVHGSNIEVEVSAGHRHGLGALSSGEKEMLAIMYFVRRLSASGGILCIDEPEQHLHPTLQAALFKAMEGLAERAQILVVSHSVNLITAAPLGGLIDLKAPDDGSANQLERLKEKPDRLELMGVLGVTPASLLQSDAILVVEGETDAKWLGTLFPIELGRTHVIVAGNADKVLAAHDALSSLPIELPWLCLRDRDLLKDDEIAEMQSRYPALHVWPKRAIESVLLDGRLISRVLVLNGVNVTPTEVEGWLRECAEPLQEEVLAAIVERELSRAFPPPVPAAGTGRFARMEQVYRGYVEVNRNRADELTTVLERERTLLESRWPTEWHKLAEPKALMGNLQRRTPLFRTVSALETALLVRAREEPDFRPEGFEEFRLRLASTLGGGAPQARA